MDTATDTIVLKKRSKNLILWIAGYCIFGLLYYAVILEALRKVGIKDAYKFDTYIESFDLND